jgi:hypothetical protein
VVEVVRLDSVIECDVASAADEEAVPYAVVVPYTTFEVAASSVVHVIVALVVVGVPDEIAEITGGVLSRVTVTAVEVA